MISNLARIPGRIGKPILRKPSQDPQLSRDQGVMDQRLGDTRQEIIRINAGFTSELVSQIMDDCNLTPAFHAARWVESLVRKAPRESREIALISMIAMCRGLGWVIKDQVTDAPRDVEEILVYTLGSAPWTATPYKMPVAQAMLRAAIAFAEAWSLD